MDIHQIRFLDRLVPLMLGALLFSLAETGWALDPDHLEVNDTAETGTVVSAPFSEQGLTIHDAADYDYFRIELLAGQKITIDALFTDSDPDNFDEDIDLELQPPIGSGGSAVIAKSFTSNERIVHIAQFTGVYVLEVRGVSFATNTYDLLITIDDDDELCFPVVLKSGGTAIICL